MIPALIATITPIIGKVIDRVVPDLNAAARTKLDIEEALVEAANQGALAQLEVNKVEAAHRSVFVAGWRPAIGWICAITIGWNYIGLPLLQTWAILSGHENIELPAIDMEYILELIFGMLGLASMRSWEKSKGFTK